MKRARDDCPYLDTIQRSVLNFDVETKCSVTLQTLNIYACLVCGKYFQGRSNGSPAYSHSLEGHHVFVNMHSLKFYCLPDNYEFLDSSLEDIKYAINPTYTEHDLEDMDALGEFRMDLSGTKYLPGYIPMVKGDHISICIQIFAHVPPIRNYFLLNDALQEVPGKISLLVRKLWNKRSLKAYLTHTILVQQKVLTGVLAYLINTKKNAFRCLQGTIKTEKGLTKFYFLTLTLPESSVFEEFVKINLLQLLERFNVVEYPDYLILNFKRPAERDYFTVDFSSNLEYGPKGYELFMNIADAAIQVKAGGKWVSISDKAELMPEVFAEPELQVWKKIQ